MRQLALAHIQWDIVNVERLLSVRRHGTHGRLCAHWRLLLDCRQRRLGRGKGAGRQRLPAILLQHVPRRLLRHGHPRCTRQLLLLLLLQVRHLLLGHSLGLLRHHRARHRACVQLRDCLHHLHLGTALALHRKRHARLLLRSCLRGCMLGVCSTGRLDGHLLHDGLEASIGQPHVLHLLLCVHSNRCRAHCLH